jgi:hypothetical protein
MAHNGCGLAKFKKIPMKKIKNIFLNFAKPMLGVVASTNDNTKHRTLFVFIFLAGLFTFFNF